MDKSRWELEGVHNLWLRDALRDNSNCTKNIFVKTEVGNSSSLSCVHSFAVTGAGLNTKEPLQYCNSFLERNGLPHCRLILLILVYKFDTLRTDFVFFFPISPFSFLHIPDYFLSIHCMLLQMPIFGWNSKSRKQKMIFELKSRRTKYQLKQKKMRTYKLGS